MGRQRVLVMAIGVLMAAGVATWRLTTRPAPEPAAAPEPAPSAAPASSPAAEEPPPAAPVRRRPARAPETPPAEPAAPPAALATATLHITSDVPDAQVFVDRKFIGTAPATAEGIAPGEHQINVSAPGYDGVAETVDVLPGPREIMISLKAIRLDESIAVKHKHGMGGSCSGRLMATPEGIRYETDNTKDGFTVALTGLETFTMDFAAKNLKIKIKGGRSYDFTDPDGSAEPLYFFHQAVEKARERMAKGSGLTPDAEDR